MFKTKIPKSIPLDKLYDKCQNDLNLKTITDVDLSKVQLRSQYIERPGLSLSGYLEGFNPKKMYVFGEIEINYLQDLHPNIRFQRLQLLITQTTPVIIIANDLNPLKEIKELCKKHKVALWHSSKSAVEVFSIVTKILSDAFAPVVSCHGTLVEAFGVGLLIQGDSSIGKSEAALGLIERGHRLVSDDVVTIKRKEENVLVGEGPELTRHLLEIRGIGIINVAHLFGAVCISRTKRIDLIVKLEEWDDNHFYDRVGLEEKYCDVLGVKIIYHILPVKPGRDVSLLLETIVLNHRLKEMGYNSAKEFNTKLLKTIAQRQENRKKTIETVKRIKT